MAKNYKVSNITLIQWNINSVLGNLADLESLYDKTTFDILALNETRLKPHHHFNFKNFNCFRLDESSSSRGVMTLVNNLFHAKQIHTRPSHIESVVCQVDIGAFQINIANVYCSPNKSFTSTDFKAIFDDIPSPKIITGDFNAHSAAWGCDDENARGRMLLDLIIQENLVFLNTGSATHISPPPKRDSAIDLTFCSASVANISEWATVPCPYFSAHIPTVTTICISGIRSRQTEVIAHNWKKFYQYVETNINEIVINHEDVQQSYDSTVTLVDSALNHSKFISKTNKRCPWWDAECEALYKNKILALRNYRDKYDKPSFIEFNRISAQTRKVFKLKKKAKWDQFCSSTYEDKSLKSVYKMWSGYSHKKNYKKSCDDQQILRDLHQRLTPCHVPDNGDFINDFPDAKKSFITDQISMNELEYAISNLKNTTPGIDGIKAICWTKTPENFKQRLLTLFNIIYKKACIPVQWRDCKLIGVPKPNDPSARRPICLILTSRKLFEKILCTRLEWWLESNNKLNDTQFGFRRYKSTRDCSLQLAINSYAAVNSKQHLYTIFFDIKSAFDNVVIKILCMKLHLIGLPKDFIKMIFSLTEERKLHITLDNLTGIIETRSAFMGLPQGSVLSPLLFTIYFDIRFAHEAITYLQYADDLAVMICAKNADEATLIVQLACNAVTDWCFENGLELSSGKCAVLPFSRCHATPQITAKINDGNIKVVNSYNYLGINFDRKCTWNLHLNSLIPKSSRILNLLKMICKTTWGGNPESMIILYKTLLRSLFDFAAIPILCASKTYYQRIERIQFAAIRVATGCMRSTPTNALEIVAGVLPLDLRCQQVITTFTAKCTNASTYNSIRIIRETAANSKLASILQGTNDVHRTDVICFDVEYKSAFYEPVIDLRYREFLKGKKGDILIHEHQEIFRKVTAQYDHCNIVYTDGSKVDSKISYAVYHKDCYEESALIPHAKSSFEAESTALMGALKHLLQYHSSINNSFVIATDCLSALLSIASKRHPSKLHRTILQVRDLAYQLVSEGNKTVFLWVPSHSGINGNETVDKIARSTINASHDNDRTNQSNSLMDAWQERWNISEKGRRTYLTLHSVSLKPWFKNMNLHKSDVRVLNRLLTNHARNNKHLTRIGIKSSNLCECYQQEETSEHILFDCHHYDRVRLLTFLHAHQFTRPYDCNYLMRRGPLLEEILQEFLHFIHLNNLRDKF